MNKEKAIKMLKHCGAESHCYDYNHGKHCEGCNQRIAQDMAIEALKIEAIPVEWVKKWMFEHPYFFVTVSTLLCDWQKEQRKENE